MKIIQEVKVTSSKDMIDMELDASDVFLNDSKCTVNMQLIGNLCGDVTITRVGIRAKIEYDYTPAVKVKMVVQMRKGYVGDCQDTVKLYKNTFWPSTSSSIAFIDHAKNNTFHAYDGFCLELKVSGYGRAWVKSCIVFVRAQGGKIRYIDDGEDVAARRLCRK